MVDVRNEAQVDEAVRLAEERFGGIDILVNNASAIYPFGILETPRKRYDLMMDTNVRGRFVCTQACLPHLLRAANPHPRSWPRPPWILSQDSRSITGRCYLDEEVLRAAGHTDFTAYAATPGTEPEVDAFLDA